MAAATASPIALATVLEIGSFYGLDEDERESLLEQFDDEADDQTLELGRNFEIRVCTEQGRDDAWEAELDSYLDDCILPELPESMRFYFDEEKWKRDARFDGAGHALNHYDGVELEASAEVDGVPNTSEWRFAYRTN